MLILGIIQKGVQIGLLLFGFFFGAGNLIFPSSLGFQSGPDFLSAISGFILTGVGLPVLALIVGTFNPGGYRAEMTQKLSPKISLAILVLIYLLIGPFMASPRTAATAYSVGVEPIFGNSSFGLAIYTAIYFTLAWWLSITPSKLMARVGKVLTPIFAVMIVVLFVAGIGSLPVPEDLRAVGKYALSPFGTGFIEGYNTADTLASFAFCLIVLGALKQFSFRSKGEYVSTIWLSGAVVALLMGGLYFGLGLLGNRFAIPAEVLSNPNINIGAYILTQTANLLFGSVGQLFLAVMVSLTCFTTSVGLNVSVSEFFNEEFPRLSYKKWVTLCTAIELIVANLGLNAIIQVALPALLFIYPLAITVLLLTIVNKWLPLSRLGMQITAAVAAVISLLDILKQFAQVTWAADIIASMPFAEIGLSWFVPVLICVGLSLFLPGKIRSEV